MRTDTTSFTPVSDFFPFELWLFDPRTIWMSDCRKRHVCARLGLLSGYNPYIPSILSNVAIEGGGKGC